MLIAVDENGERVVADKDLKRSTKYYCPSCQNAVHFKKGSMMRPHFAHYKNEACDIFSEGETEEHITGKLALHKKFEEQGHEVQMEAYLPELRQRPDLLVDDGLAVEFQCSQIPINKVVERTDGYIKAGYEVVWILGEKFRYKKQLTAFQKACLTEWQGNICLFYYTVAKQKLTVTSTFGRAASQVDYRKRHQQLQRLLSYETTSFQKLLYANHDSLISMPVELYHPVPYEWMIQGNSYIWKYQFILWLETFPFKRIVTKKMIDRWIDQNIKYYPMPQISTHKKKRPIYAYIKILVKSGVLKEISKGKWSLIRYPQRYKYLEEKF